MYVFGATDIGRVRSSNQDSYRCGKLNETAVYAIVCDGMGGANGGNIASNIAADIMEKRVVSQYRENMPEASVLNMLESAVDAANIEVFDRATADPELMGMGTTLITVIVDNGRAMVVHVGDSRVYYLSSDELRQVTTDHSVVQEMIQKGQITEEQAKAHPRKHFITRAIGVENEVRPDFDVFDMKPKDRVLLCSDGLTNMIQQEKLKALLGQNAVDTLPAELISQANENGGEDNITAVIIEQC